MKKSLLLLSVLIMLGCNLPTSPTDVDAMTWWPEAENRILNWLYIHPECGILVYVKPSVTAVVRGDVPTCTYDDDRREVVVGYNTPPGACMAHELGHAALEQAGNKCWRDYEHDRIAPQRPDHIALQKPKEN